MMYDLRNYYWIPGLLIQTTLNYRNFKLKVVICYQRE